MKFCCISRLYSYRKKLYCVHVVPFFLWYQKSGHSGLEGILNWWWRNITKRKTDKHVPFPTCPFPLKSTDFVTLPDFATPTIGEEKIHYQHQACQNQATAEQIDTAFAEPTETPLSSAAVFPCTETGCIKIFCTFSGLEHHLLCGTHKYSSARPS